MNAGFAELEQAQWPTAEQWSSHASWQLLLPNLGHPPFMNYGSLGSLEKLSGKFPRMVGLEPLHRKLSFVRIETAGLLYIALTNDRCGLPASPSRLMKHLARKKPL